MLPLAELKDILLRNTVSMRGWPVPFIDYRRDDLHGNDWIGQDIDALNVDHLEAWRFYTSAQFSHLRVVSADWRRHGEETPVPAGASAVIEVWEILFYLVELVELGARLALVSGSADFVFDVELVGMTGRALVAGDPSRQLHGLYIFAEPKIHYRSAVDTARLVAETRAVAVEISIEIMSRFGFFAQKTMLMEYQATTLTGQRRAEPK